ncbi:MAG: alpha/beta hydrolase [Eubacteriales bacterium]|nr:alpha/beta hydrolase [Eubacteriales bacterium]
MKKKYEYDKELRAYSHLHTPVVPALAPLTQWLMKLLYVLQWSGRHVRLKKRRVAVDGAKIRVLEYTPKAGSDGGCIIFFHGGGFIFEAAPHNFWLARRFASELKCKTLFVDYRLAPLHRFPCAPFDCYAVYKWVLKNADELNIDPRRIILYGDSAGANLAAVVSMMARDEQIQLPCAQMLMYPFVDRRLNTQSMSEFTDTPMCNTKDMYKYLKAYVHELDPKLLPYFSPMEASTLGGLPHAYIEVAEFDCLRDDGILYAQRLRHEGVSAELHLIKGAMHGYDIAAKSGIVKECESSRKKFILKEWN